MPKNIIICCDGTGNEFGTNNTNVVVTYQLATKDDTQMALYDPGVGTGGWEFNESTGGLKAISAKATGEGVQKNVNDAYRALMRYYEPDDKVFLFGFSRGAFTARSLAGMLHKVGLLGEEHEALLEYATKLYNTKPTKKNQNSMISKDFKATFSINCPVHFIGVWDTVDSTILNEGRRFTNAKLNPEVGHAYHAISIDERRRDFPVYLWDHPNKEGTSRSVQQVWFPGVHSDVGGWYPERGLANGALRWMMSKAAKHGMKIDKAALKAGFAPKPKDKIHESYSGFWVFRGDDQRIMPANSLFHRSVEKRRNGGVGYAPGNVSANPTYVDDDPAL